MHWPNPTIHLQETIDALGKLKDSGKIKHYGVCNMSHKQVEGLGINAIQNEYNLFDRSAEDLFGHCEKHDILFVAYSPFQYFHSLSPDSMVWLQEIAFKYQVSMSRIALSWIVSHKNVIAIPKTHDLAHQKLNSMPITLTDEEIKKINDLFPYVVAQIPPELIKVSKTGKFPQTLEEAKNNITHFVPSPLELAESLDEIKPVRVEVRDGVFELIEGGLRYWAWVIKNGNKPIPALIREDFVI